MTVKLKLPVRKCYHIVKVVFILGLVVSVLSLFEFWRGGKRTILASHGDDAENELERQVREDEMRIVTGLGDGGLAAHLEGVEKQLGEESEKKLAINVYLSDRIAYNRTLKDFRNPGCSRLMYDAELPSASVVIIFHNEPYSVVVRTVWSVLNSVRRDRPWYQRANRRDPTSGANLNLGYPGQPQNSPFVYLKEIILVDDNSTLPELKDKLSHYIRTRMPPDIIRILRLPDRIGLTRARLEGAKMSAGDVIVFLDAHCETQPDWLRPMLQRIKSSITIVVTPLIDMLAQNTLEYQSGGYRRFEVGGFTFQGHFNWIEVPERELKRRGSPVNPTWSPTMAGGLFAISRSYFWHLGAYDEQMSGWGGENLEISFRIWQCGGTLETVPCSRVGHVFRSFHPYGLPGSSDTHGINTARMAEVWMDDYKELYYLHRPDLRKNPKIGDVTHRKVLREKLQCKSFQWYLDHVYREKFVPVRDVYGFGRFRNTASELCLDTLQRDTEGGILGVYSCHGSLMSTQYFSLTLRGELRDEERCAEVQYEREPESGAGLVERRVVMITCHGKQRSQKWRRLVDGALQHVESGLCLQAGPSSGADVIAAPCSPRQPAQSWTIDYSEENDFVLRNDRPPTEQELVLRSLRGQRRISRSLLSYSKEEKPEPRVSKKKKHSKRKNKKKVKRVKNKFILKVLRSFPNNSEEHLEVDIHCKHRKLYPNNTFVRDLVTILNNNDIKVINNGRIFERNRVTDISNNIEKDTNQFTPKRVLEKMPIAMDTKPQAVKVAKVMPPEQEKVKPMKNQRAGNQPKVENKRIIIEDFVEIKSSTDQPKTLKRKRKRMKPKTKANEVQIDEKVVPPGDAVREQPEEELESRKMRHKQEEEVAAQDSDVDGGQSAGSNTIQRKNMNVPVTSREGSATSGEEGGHSPVKLVLKSNLTFNLGDEFFSWKRSNDVDRSSVEEAAAGASSPPPKPLAPPRMMDSLEAETSDDSVDES